MFSLHGTVNVIGEVEVKKISQYTSAIKCKVITQNNKGDVTPQVDLEIIGSADKVDALMKKDISDGRVLDIINSELSVKASKFEKGSPWIAINAKVDDVKVMLVTLREVTESPQEVSAVKDKGLAF